MEIKKRDESKPQKNKQEAVDLILDKKFIKKCCRLLYIFGFENCWYETGEGAFSIPPKLYTIWFTFLNLISIVVIGLEVLGNLRTDLTRKEKNDVAYFSIAHASTYLKFVVFILKKEEIKVFLQKMIEDLRIPGTAKFEKAVIKRSKIYITTLALSMICSLSFSTINTILISKHTGNPRASLVVYWPRPESVGVLATIMRIVIDIFWWYYVISMLVLDGFCIITLTILSFRFRTLQNYFESLREDIIENVDNKGVNQLEEELIKGFVRGVKLHSETIWCANSLQESLGLTYSTQVIQSIGLLSICLIKLVTLELNLSFLLASLTFTTFMIVKTGCYMMTGGDVTYEASMISTSMFHCGWDLVQNPTRLKQLLVVAIQCSNRPVIMSAFGVFDLSYSNYISVLKSSYSFFALMY